MRGVELTIQSRREDAPQRELKEVIDDAPAPSPSSEARCRAVIDRVLAVLRAHKAEAAPKGLHTFTFVIRDLDDAGARTEPRADFEFFREAATFGALHPLLHAYALETAAGAHGHAIWSNDETPSGTYAILPLVMHDRKWIPEYVRFLRSNDLDHEVDQAGDIQDVIERYGWASDTLALAAARLVSCQGQFGEEQFGQLLEEGLSDHLDTAEGRGDFLEVARREFDAWLGETTRQGRHAHAAHDTSEIDAALEGFAGVLTGEELGDLRAHAYARRASRG